MKARVFASLKQIVGAGEIEFPASTVGELLRAAEAAYGEEFASQIPHCTVVVNDESFSPDDARELPVSEGDDVAILPPVAGGDG